MTATLIKLQLALSVIKERKTDLRVNYVVLTSFPELVHVNFSMIVGKIFWPCLFCTVVQLANLSMDHVIDALAANVIITRAQTVNRAWKFEGLVNMVEESSAIDWLKSLHTRRCLQHWNSKPGRVTKRGTRPKKPHPELGSQLDEPFSCLVTQM